MVGVTRRMVLAGTTLALAGAAVPLVARRAWAVTTIQAGDLRIDSVSDGYLIVPTEFFTAALPPDQRDALMAQFAIPAGQVESACNVTLLRAGDRVALFDVGSGPDFVPTTGKLPEALAAVGVAPDDVTDVVFTHAHPDHLWGLLDDFDEPVFANARLQIGQVEHAYWTDPATVDSIDPTRQPFAVGARRRLDAVADRIETFADGAEVLPGVRATRTPGHTPGHMAFAIGTPDAGLVVTGDAIINATIAFGRPELLSSSDQDPPLAAQTRVSLLNHLAEHGWTMLGYHLPGGGIGRVERDGAAFRFVPAD